LRARRRPGHFLGVDSTPTRFRGRLRRLQPAAYRGFTFVHWSMTLKDRAVGWLDSRHHAVVREILCHALARYRLVCPTYCLMPDHGHFLWIGCAAVSDQERAVALFRHAWNEQLRPANCQLERQPFDRVLSERERQHDAFLDVAGYILDNPMRAGLVGTRAEWPYSGAVVPGYPRLSPQRPDYWELFWRIYAQNVDPYEPADGVPKRRA
jgi:putative transposase